MDQAYLAALLMIPGIGQARAKALVSFFGNAYQAWQANRCDLFFSQCLDETTCNNLIVYREKIDVQGMYRQWEKQGIKLCSLYEAEFPGLLKNIFNPPLLLYYRGLLPQHQNLISIFGARRATVYGKNVAKMIAAELAAAGIWIVSGAARGIDSAAHQGALTKGNTIAVLGCGIDIVYPKENEKLLCSIAEQGAVISDYPPGTNPHPSFFPARNRIINGLAKGVLVVEAAEKSGALITVDYALEEGRDVFAVPGNILSPLSKGTHRLIKQGAKLIDSAWDILEEYQIARPVANDCLQLSEEERQVFGLLTTDNPVDIEEIMIKTKLSSSTVTYILLQFELRGLAVSCQGQKYILVAREGIR